MRNKCMGLFRNLSHNFSLPLHCSFQLSWFKSSKSFHCLTDTYTIFIKSALLQFLYSPFHYFKFACRRNVGSLTYHVLCSDDSWIIFQNICNNRLFKRTLGSPCCRIFLTAHHETRILDFRFIFSLLISVLRPFPRTGRDMRRKSEKFHLSLYYFRWAIGSSENLRVPDF